MIQRPSRTGTEPVNELIMSWKEMARLKDTQNKIPKKTHTHTLDTFSQFRLPLVPLSDLSELPVLGQHKPDQGEDSAPELSSCGPRSSSGESDGVPVAGQDGNQCHFLQDRCVSMTHHEPLIVPPKAKVTQKSSSISCLARISFYGILSS